LPQITLVFIVIYRYRGFNAPFFFPLSISVTTQNERNPTDSRLAVPYTLEASQSKRTCKEMSQSHYLVHKSPNIASKRQRSPECRALPTTRGRESKRTKMTETPGRKEDLLLSLREQVKKLTAMVEGVESTNVPPNENHNSFHSHSTPSDSRGQTAHPSPAWSLEDSHEQVSLNDENRENVPTSPNNFSINDSVQEDADGNGRERDHSDQNILTPDLDRSHPFHCRAAEALNEIENNPVISYQELLEMDLTHSTHSIYFLPPKMNFIVHEGAAMLAIFYRGQEHLLPVDQERITVSIRENAVCFQIRYTAKKLREQFLPFIATGFIRPPTKDTSNSVKDLIKRSIPMFKEDGFTSAVGLEVNYHPMKRTRVIYKEPDLSQTIIKLDKDAKESRVPPIPKPLFDIISTKENLEEYFNENHLKIPNNLGGLQKFLNSLNSTQVFVEFENRQRARRDLHSAVLSQFAQKAVSFFAMNNRSEAEDSTLDLQLHLGSLSNFMTISSDMENERYQTSLLQALRAKHKLRLNLLGRMQPTVVANILLEDSLLTPGLWSRDAIDKAIQELRVLQSRKDGTIYRRADGSSCDSYGSLRQPFQAGTGRNHSSYKFEPRQNESRPTSGHIQKYPIHKFQPNAVAGGKSNFQKRPANNKKNNQGSQQTQRDTTSTRGRGFNKQRPQTYKYLKPTSQ